MNGALTLIQTIILAADGDPIVFSGLNGDADKIYLILFNAITRTDYTTAVLKPNGVATNQKTALTVNASGGVVGPILIAALCFANNAVGALYEICGKVLFYAHSGKRRQIVVECAVFEPIAGGQADMENGGGWWDDTVNNITSIIVDTDGTGFKAGSRFSLYKFIQ